MKRKKIYRDLNKENWKEIFKEYLLGKVSTNREDEEEEAAEQIVQILSIISSPSSTKTIFSARFFPSSTVAAVFRQEKLKGGLAICFCEGKKKKEEEAYRSVSL